jgi:hypothetical protein
MGIEPTRAAPLGLENKQFGATADPKCDGRVNFRGMWGHVGVRRDTSVGEIWGSSLPGVGLLPAKPKPKMSAPLQSFATRSAGRLSLAAIGYCAQASYIIGEVRYINPAL